jgi:hypothetical protein
MAHRGERDRWPAVEATPAPWWKRLRVRLGFDPHNPAWPFATPWSRHEVALYVLCFFVQVEWFPREWDDGAA